MTYFHLNTFPDNKTLGIDAKIVFNVVWFQSYWIFDISAIMLVYASLLDIQQSLATETCTTHFCHVSPGYQPSSGLLSVCYTDNNKKCDWNWPPYWIYADYEWS